MHKVIINADDFGYGRGINYGIIDSYKNGILTSTTMMANMPGFEHGVSLSKEHPELGIGVHLNLTCGYPLLEDLKTIVDKETGLFKSRSFYETLNFQVDKEEVYREWDAQIQKVINSGIEPSHLDSHHHVHAYGANQEVVIKLARKYKLPVRNIILEIPEDVPTTERFEMNFDSVGSVPELYGEPYLKNLLDDFQNVESIEIMCHPGYLDKEIIKGSKLTENRAFMVDFLVNSEFAQKLQSNKNISLTTFHELQ